MGLSQNNVNKLCITGLYACKPVLEWLPSYERDTPYWCRNWTFRVRKHNDNYYMCDTYWSIGDEYPIKLTDDNFDKFVLLFDFNDVEEFHGSYRKWTTYHSNDRFCAAVNSSGIYNPKYYIRKGLRPIKEVVIETLKYDIEIMEKELEHQREKLRRVENDEIDLRYV